MTTAPCIELRNTSKVFETTQIETHALDKITLKIDCGEFVAIIGPSGGGKSTLLSIVGLLDTPTAGTYHLEGREVERLGVNERARIRNREIGFVFQSFNLIGDLSVLENVELPLIYGGMPATERAERVDKALERVGMAHRRHHYPGQLSGGEQQRVAIARAICGEPTLLLADEPTGNLDSKNGDAIIDLISELHQNGTTVCMVTHDPRYARRAERQIILFDGRIVDKPDETMQAVLEEHGFSYRDLS